jgi:hypothetical protein
MVVGYSTTGEPSALKAARWAWLSLLDVIERTAELMNGGDDSALNSLQQYMTALEEEKEGNALELAKKTGIER